MEKRKAPGSKAGAMGGKSFYVVLFLCAAVIGVSAWILLAGNNGEDMETAETMVDVSDAVVTIVPAGTPEETVLEEEEDAETAAEEPEEEDLETAAYEAEEVFSEAVTSYVWPVQGDIEVPYSIETLLYDATMADWRTHDGIDVACDLGTQVLAVAGGTVVSVREDDLAGTVVEIDHANGMHSIYANLAAEPPVSEGEVVTMGQVIGSVGGTALGETNEVPHLHFAMTRDGLSADPMDYLPTDWTEE